MVLLYHALNIQTESEDQGLSGTPLFVILTSIFESKITVSNSWTGHVPQYLAYQ